MALTDSQFHQLVDDLFAHCEACFDEEQVDFDYECQNGILTLSFDDGSKIILNRQEPLHQIWLATKFNGHHYDYREQQWIDDRSGDELIAFLEQAIERQSGEQVTLRTED